MTRRRARTRPHVSARTPDVPKISGFCADCPDHEACATGTPCAVPLAVNEPPAVAGPYEIEQVETKDESGDLIVTFDMPVGIVPGGEVEGSVSVGFDDGPIQPLVLSGRQSMWLDRLMAKDDTRAIRRALKDQGWTIAAPTGRTNRHERAFPPGVDPADGWPYVLLPSTIGEGRAVANLVAALRRAGPFKWKGR